MKGFMHRASVALVALSIPVLAHAQTFTVVGTELDATETAIAAILTLAGVFIVGWATLRLFGKGARQVK